ncbi:oxygen-insensitive NADPH nitroreductase [Bacillus massiliigorillae]|uniref:oxygen-insensitive NADPH nitroreductase n=1 Tax=Bacillus massiliigorillae TaxID=1243664 RepID=UPI00039E3F40|nr:oxygen-insensitive NADPH nitroreductase [Bacillus massiliigorillae]
MFQKMNTVIDRIMNHRSIRKFKNEKLSEEQIHTIIQAAQMASSSRFMQNYSIIGVSDPQIKKRLHQLTGKESVEVNGHFLIFCADLHRITLMATEEEKQKMRIMLESTQFFQIATIDAALAAQNAALSAESMGLEIVYIGAISNHLEEIDKMLQLPDYVVPLFGMCIGVPTVKPEQKPRLPLKSVYFENHYNQNAGEQRQLIQAYDEQMYHYYGTRTKNNSSHTWSQKNITLFQGKSPLENISSYVQNKKLNRY